MPNAWYELDEINSLGDCIRLNRLKNGLTQAQLAETIGIDKNTLYALETDKAFLHVHFIIQIENTLKCSLIGYDDYYDFTRNTATNIKELRLNLKMSPLEFSNLIEVNRNTVYKWESGKSVITRTHFKKIVKLGLSTNQCTM